MKQVIQSAKTGELEIIDVPPPSIGPRDVLVRTHASVVSPGTERSIVRFAEKNLVQKARSRPDLVRQVMEKVQRDGLLDTMDAVRNRLDQATPLGYSAAGTVVRAGAEVENLRTGDRVACAGQDYAVHAQLISVPRNLVARVPDGVEFEEAAFTTMGAIAMHGMRLAELQLGDVVAVIGLGLLGQLTVQMARASGAIVVGLDLRADRAELAMRHGAVWAGTDSDELLAQTGGLSEGRGADAVLITADSQSNQPVELAGEIARSRGRVISVGAVGTELPRKSYFLKELDFRVSRSYGPGRYDKSYEEQGLDYPYDYVRWTENRNMQAFLSLLERGAVDVASLITHRYEIDAAKTAYDLILGRLGEPSLGVVLHYAAEPETAQRVPMNTASAAIEPAAEVRAGVLGAGLFANAVLLPAMSRTEHVRLVGISSGGGLSARTAAKKFGFDWCASSSDQILADRRIDLVAILTRHHLHARQTIAALRAGKHVFVEKPLCLTHEELDEIVAAYDGTRMLMVGFNRRFAPMVAVLRDSLRAVSEPLLLTYRVNAGFIPADHWVHDPAQGGGRLRGEGCHFIDLLIDLAGSPVRRVTTRVLPDSGKYRQDNVQVTLECKNGSVGTVLYSAGGSRSFGKETIEAFGGGVAARLDDFRALEIRHGSKRIRESSRLRQDKGHRREWERIASHLTAGTPPPVAFADLVHSTRATLAAWDSLDRGETVTL